MDYLVQSAAAPGPGGGGDGGGGGAAGGGGGGGGGGRDSGGGQGFDGHKKNSIRKINVIFFNTKYVVIFQKTSLSLLLCILTFI